MVRIYFNLRSSERYLIGTRFASIQILLVVSICSLLGCGVPLEVQTPTVTAAPAHTLTPSATLPPAEATLAYQQTSEAERFAIEQRVLSPMPEPTITPTYGPASALSGVRFQPRGRSEALSVCANPQVASVNTSQRVSAWYFRNQIDDGNLVAVDNLFNAYWDSATGLGSVERLPGICTNDSLYFAGSTAISPTGEQVRPYYGPERIPGANIAPQQGMFLPFEAFAQPGQWTLSIQNEEASISIDIEVPTPQQPMFMREIDGSRIWIGGFDPMERAVLVVFDEVGFASDFRIQMDEDGMFISSLDGIGETQGFVIVGEAGNVVLPNNLAGSTPDGQLLSREYLLDLYWAPATP